MDPNQDTDKANQSTQEGCKSMHSSQLGDFESHEEYVARLVRELNETRTNYDQLDNDYRILKDTHNRLLQESDGSDTRFSQLQEKNSDLARQVELSKKTIGVLQNNLQQAEQSLSEYIREDQKKSLTKDSHNLTGSEDERQRIILSLREENQTQQQEIEGLSKEVHLRAPRC